MAETPPRPAQASHPALANPALAPGFRGAVGLGGRESYSWGCCFCGVGKCDSTAPGADSFRFLNFRKHCLGLGHYGWAREDPSESPPQSQGRGRCPSPHYLRDPPPCGLKALRFWEEAAAAVEGVCLLTGFNLKHMYWLELIRLTWRQDHKNPSFCVP